MGGLQEAYKTISSVQLLNYKSEFNMSESCYNRILSIVKNMLPEDEKLVSNFYRTKKMVAKLGLGYEKIDACVNNCILYYKENAEKVSCSVCGHPRYKPKLSSFHREKDKSYKVLHYLPLTPRLQRLYMSQKTSNHMTWHVSNHCRDGYMAHPVDSEAWKHFSRTHPSFASDPRNVRIGLCTDGFNPFGKFGTPYLCWPIIVTVYNLPPGMCMKNPYMFLTIVIPGPKNPGKHLDVFLRPLIDELKMLWSIGVNTYDAFRKQNFLTRVALMWTISDFPAYAMLSGWSTHGRLACPYCMERTKSLYLKVERRYHFLIATVSSCLKTIPIENKGINSKKVLL